MAKPTKKRNVKGRKPAKRRNRTGRRGPGKIVSFFMLVGTVTVMVVSLPMFMVIVAGMVPTVVAYFVDREPEKYAPVAVGAFNMVGVLPFILDLWTGAANISAAIDLLINPFTWLIMYGAASLGWVMYLGLPSFAAVWLEASAESQIGRLRKEQAKLIEDWGEDLDPRTAVATDP